MLHSPIWKPYGLYGQVDNTYGFGALYAGLGFTAAQATVNAMETTAYLVYLYVVYRYGQQEARQGRGAPSKSMMGSLKALSESRTVYGQAAARAVLLAFTTSSITFAKTVIYGTYWCFFFFLSIRMLLTLVQCSMRLSVARMAGEA